MNIISHFRGSTAVASSYQMCTWRSIHGQVVTYWYCVHVVHLPWDMCHQCSDAMRVAWVTSLKYFYKTNCFPKLCSSKTGANLQVLLLHFQKSNFLRIINYYCSVIRLTHKSLLIYKKMILDMIEFPVYLLYTNKYSVSNHTLTSIRKILKKNLMLIQEFLFSLSKYDYNIDLNQNLWKQAEQL